MHSFHSVKLMSSIKAVGPFIPAFAQRTSIVSQSFFIFSKSFFTALSSRTSVCDFFHSLGQLSSCSLLLSAIQTLSPLTSKVIAIALPMPDAPAVIKTFRDI